MKASRFLIALVLVVTALIVSTCNAKSVDPERGTIARIHDGSLFKGGDYVTCDGGSDGEFNVIVPGVKIPTYDVGDTCPDGVEW